MSLNLFAQDEGFWRQLARELAEEGMAVVRQVRLPNIFQPPASDLIFLVCDAGIELYLDARIQYTGHSAIWQQIQQQPPLPGPARLVAQADLDAAAAFRLLRTLLLDAGGALGEVEFPAEVALPPMTPDEMESLVEILAHLGSEMSASDEPIEPA